MSAIFDGIVRALLVFGIVLLLAGRGNSAPVVDASNDVGGSSAALSLRPSNFWAQSFTATTDGLLMQIDVQVGKFAGATGDVQFELRPLVGGLPTLDDAGRLFASMISIDAIPVINALADPPAFVSVDVSAAGIHAKPGDQFAISLRRSGGSPVAAWRSRPNSYAGGVGYFRSLLSSPWSASVEELGFQSWIDSAPSAPYKLRVDPTFDVEYRPGTISSLHEGAEELIVGGVIGSTNFPEKRPIMEFPIGDLPADAIVQGAYLELDYYVSSGAPRIEIMGFAGDGLASFADATTAGTLLAVTGPTSASSSPVLPLEASFFASLAGQASHAGIRMRGLDGTEYVGFYASEDEFPTVLPPRLVIEYTLPGHADGDFNFDGVVDGVDLLEWQRGLPGSYGPTDLTKWKANFGLANSSLTTATPEPAAWVLAITAAAVAGGRRGRRSLMRIAFSTSCESPS